MEKVTSIKLNGVSFSVISTEGDYGIEDKVYSLGGDELSLREIIEVLEAIKELEPEAFYNIR